MWKYIAQRLLPFAWVIGASLWKYRKITVISTRTIGRTIESRDNGLISGCAYNWDFTVCQCSRHQPIWIWWGLYRSIAARHLHLHLHLPAFKFSNFHFRWTCLYFLLTLYNINVLLNIFWIKSNLDWIMKRKDITSPLVLSLTILLLCLEGDSFVNGMLPYVMLYCNKHSIVDEMNMLECWFKDLT